MTMVLDSGALIAIEAGDRELLALLKKARLDGRPPRTHGGVIAQVWRGGRDAQVPLAMAMQALEVLDLSGDLGKQAGVLLGRTGLDDAVDSALVCIAFDGDTLYTSDPGDLAHLASARDLHVDVVKVS